MSGHGSQSLIILHFSPFGGGEGDGRKTVTKLVINAKRYFHLLSFFFFFIKQQHDVPHGETLQSHVLATSQCGTPLQLLREQPSIGFLCDGGGGGGGSLVLASSGLQGGSVLTAPRSGQGRGARVASDPERERERMDGFADPL